jgi:hypothetical protein
MHILLWDYYCRSPYWLDYALLPKRGSDRKTHLWGSQSLLRWSAATSPGLGSPTKQKIRYHLWCRVAVPINWIMLSYEEEVEVRVQGKTSQSLLFGLGSPTKNNLSNTWSKFCRSPYWGEVLLLHLDYTLLLAHTLKTTNSDCRSP